VGERLIPEEPLAFIKQCVIEGRMLWSYHVNMRMQKRSISRKQIVEAVSSYEIIEAYPEDKYMPSYLVYAVYHDIVIHVLFAVDLEDRNVRIVTAYYPDLIHWSDNFKTRRQS
jgi:hypothetical protein